MIICKKLDNGMLEVSSDCGSVDIGEGAVDKIICSEDEKEYITEIKTQQKTKRDDPVKSTSE